MTERTVLQGSFFEAPDGTILSPVCCGQNMKDVGGCSEGCCDDFKCEVCDKRVRLEHC